MLSDALNVSTDIGADPSSAPNTAPPVASTNTSPATPIDPTMAQPAPDVPTPSTDVQDVASVDNAAAQPEPSISELTGLPETAPPQAHYGRLASMLRGMLMGLENGRSPVASAVAGLVGAAAGAAAPNRISQDYAQQQEDRNLMRQNRELNVRFANVRSALGIIEAARDRQALESLPDPLAQQANDVARKQIVDMKAAGRQFLVGPDAPGTMQALMAEAHARFGNVPLMTPIHADGLLYLAPLGEPTDSDYSNYANLATATGVVPMSQALWDAQKPEQKQEALHSVQSMFTELPRTDDPRAADALLQKLKVNFASYLENTPSWKQNADIVAKYKQRIANLTGVRDHAEAYSRQFLAQQAAAKQHAMTVSGKDGQGNWLPGSLPVALVDGTMDPSQLSKRTGNYNATLQAANEYSMQKYGQPFNIAQATIDYKYASAPATQNVLRYLNSLTGADNASGNLGALVELSNKIPRGQYPALNNTELWAKQETGNAQVTAYHAAVTEVADQVAKILQGGGTGSGTSDAKLKQAQELFDRGFTPAQIQSVASTLRTLLANRKNELIGSNRYLQRQFQRPVAPKPAVPSPAAPSTPAPQQNAGSFFNKIPGAKVRQ